jgi:alpha-1,6-mannosyltransferase
VEQNSVRAQIHSVLADDGVSIRLLAVIAGVLAFLVILGAGGQTVRDYDTYVFAVLAHGAVYCAAVWVVLRAKLHPKTLVLILVVAALLRGIAFQVPVGLTIDGYRYVWDGRLHSEGINPYLMIPNDERLKHLRDADIYPNINGADRYPTIYPPVAQIAFWIGTKIHNSIDGMKLLMALAEAVTIWALMAWMREEKQPAERVLIYAWHPLPLWEYTASAHIDAVAVAFVCLALLAASRDQHGRVGAAFAAAALVKYFPVYLMPAIWKRWWLGLPVAFVLTGLALYVPYVWGAGAKVLGSLFMHLDAEGYNEQGWGFYLAFAPKHFGWFDIGGRLYAKLAAMALVLIALPIVFRREPERIRPWHLIVLVSAFLLLVSPHYPWYYAIAVPLLVRCLYWPLLWVTLVVTAIYLEMGYVWLVPYPRFKVLSILYGGFIVLALADAAWRWRVNGRRAQ